MRMCLISVFSLLLFALTGCETSQVQTKDILDSSPSSPKKTESFSTPLPTMRTQEDDMPNDPPLTIPRSPGLQALIERAKANLSQRLSIPTSQVKVVETKEASWSDTSLGCPQPDTDYIQIPTPGYLVTLEYAGNEFEYHVGIHGNVAYCKNPTPPISGTPADTFPFEISTP